MLKANRNRLSRTLIQVKARAPRSGQNRGMTNDRLIRLFLLTALTCLALGSTLGIGMAFGLAGLTSMVDWPTWLVAHRALQVHGFVVILTLGVAMLALPRFLGVPLAAEKFAALALAFLTVALGLRSCGGASQAAGLSQAAGVAAFLVVLRRTRATATLPQVEPGERRLNRLHAMFMASGAIWLMLISLLGDEDRTADLVLWGFASMYVAGIGLRVHPQMLGLRLMASATAGWSVLLWNLGIGLQLGGSSWGQGVTIAGIALYLLWLRPFRRPTVATTEPVWMRPALWMSYGWLVLALLAGGLGPLLGHAALAGASRHLLGSGFLLTVMGAMGFRLIPLFLQRALIWDAAPPVMLSLLALGNLARTVGQVLSLPASFALGASLQLVAALLFSLTLGATVMRARQSGSVLLPSWASV